MAKKTQIKGLNNKVLTKLRKDTGLQAKIIEATKRSYPTIKRWLEENHEYLALPACLNLICSEYKITQKQALA